MFLSEDGFRSEKCNQSQNAKRASSQKRHMVISIFLPCNSLILMSVGAGSIKAIKGVLIMFLRFGTVTIVFAVKFYLKVKV